MTQGTHKWTNILDQPKNIEFWVGKLMKKKKKKKKKTKKKK